MECFDVSKCLDLLGPEVIHNIVMVVHHHGEGLAKDQRYPDKHIPEPWAMRVLTNLVMGKRGAWTSIPRKPQTLNSLRGTEMRYSWKKAEVRNTMRVAVVREAPEVTRGL